jgi:hypothetical protein
MFLDRQEDLLAVLPYAEGDKERDRGRLSVEPHPHHRAVQDETDDRLVLQGAAIPGIPIALHLTWGASRQSACFNSALVIL